MSEARTGYRVWVTMYLCRPSRQSYAYEKRERADRLCKFYQEREHGLTRIPLAQRSTYEVREEKLLPGDLLILGDDMPELDRP